MSSFLLFIEYPVKQTQWHVYKEKIPLLRQFAQQMGVTHHTLAEGVDQPYLVVETMQIDSQNLYQQIQKEHSDIIDSHIVGGRSKVKYWLFRCFSE